PDRIRSKRRRRLARDRRSSYESKSRGADICAGQLFPRDLVAFAGYLPPGEIAALRKYLPPAILIRTTTADRVRGDGVFLIESGRAAALPGLARAAYTYLSHTPAVLLDWTVRLRRKKQDGAALQLLSDFKHVLPQDSNLWRNRIELLEQRGDRQIYFDEILAYQKRYHAHFNMADRMINVLIGENAAQIRWAPESYWKTAREQLQPQTGNGRFVYWLKRYYLETKNERGQEDLKRDFYAMAPGSFYAGAFWEDFIRPGSDEDRADFARDWSKVESRQDYLRWVARHGGNDAAVQYLKHRDLTRFMDQDALKLWKDFRSGVYRSPEDLQQLYRLGERTLGANFFDHHYEGRLSKREQLAREAYLGNQAGWLHMSVYFTRQFMRDAGVPEDPFSMPAGLLKALYPRPYYGQVKRYADSYNIDSGMVYALMRQESMFREQAISRSGARGLMQIMPRTGAWLAGKMDIRNPNLMDPDTNINMGAKFFADLVRTQGDFRWASIAYNGGPGNLRKWKRQYYKDDFYFFLENLPIEEPRNYCRVTFQNYMHYKTTYTLYPED
ncbi:MAG: lytic transglycosylase domain-containing protein, partial [Leptospirales bacterium]